jgi:hypothetical protein
MCETVETGPWPCRIGPTCCAMDCQQIQDGRSPACGAISVAHSPPQPGADSGCTPTLGRLDGPRDAHLQRPMHPSSGRNGSAHSPLAAKRTLQGLSALPPVGQRQSAKGTGGHDIGTAGTVHQHLGRGDSCNVPCSTTEAPRAAPPIVGAQVLRPVDTQQFLTKTYSVQHAYHQDEAGQTLKDAAAAPASSQHSGSSQAPLSSVAEGGALDPELYQLHRRPHNARQGGDTWRALALSSQPATQAAGSAPCHHAGGASRGLRGDVEGFVSLEGSYQGAGHPSCNTCHKPRRARDNGGPWGGPGCGAHQSVHRTSATRRVALALPPDWRHLRVHVLSFNMAGTVPADLPPAMLEDCSQHAGLDVGGGNSMQEAGHNATVRKPDL